MFRKGQAALGRYARLLSVLLTSAAAAVFPAPVVAPPATAQEESCFAGVDYSQISFEELSAIVAEAVSRLPAGMSDAEIAVAIGSQLGASASGCTPEQIAALANNVTIMLQELGIDVPDLNAVLVASIANPDPAVIEDPELVAAVPPIY